jgi:DNA polymerase-1
MPTDFNALRGDDKDWTYNALDCLYTRSVGQHENAAISSMHLTEVEQFQQALFYPVLHAMLKGVRVDLTKRAEMHAMLTAEMAKRELFFTRLLGHTLNPRSSKQMKALFYDDLRQPVQWSKATKKVARHPTCDDAALDVLYKKEPILRPLIKGIREYRTLGVFDSTFVQAELDEDNRMRCSYNICGTETYRFSSSKNAFDRGTNLQNLPRVPEEVNDPDELQLPNIKSIFIPDEGYEFFDMDLSRADLYTVVWEADDADLKAAMRLNLDMHCVSACDIFDIKGIPPDELAPSHPNYYDHRKKIGEDRRYKTKAGCHAVNYFCQAKTLALALGLSVHSAQGFIDRWLGAHPGIKTWHIRTEEQLTKRRYVENAFGYRRYYFERTEGLLPAALAWIPQTTTGNVINRIWVKLFEDYSWIHILLQVHDSLSGQFPLSRRAEAVAAFQAVSDSIIVPYADPLNIPIGLKTSTESWGDCA